MLKHNRRIGSILHLYPQDNLTQPFRVSSDWSCVDAPGPMGQSAEFLYSGVEWQASSAPMPNYRVDAPCRGLASFRDQRRAAA
jgi:hypothetical protein